MASSGDKRMAESQVVDNITGYMHNVSPVKVSVRSRNKYFNAVFQSSREQYHRVVVFSPDKQSKFMQSEKNKSPVKLLNFRRCVSSAGEEFDIQCGKNTDITVTSDVEFTFKEPPQNSKKTVAEICLMAPKQYVGLVEAKVVDLKPSKTVDVRGVPTELQICYVQDATGNIKMHLWEAQVGVLLTGHSYSISNVATRSFGDDFFLTTSPISEIVEIEEVSSTLEFQAAENDIVTLVAEVSAADIKVHYRCARCETWQAEFNSKVKFHRCVKCNMLQKCETYLANARGNISIVGTFGQQEVSVSNLYLKRYLEGKGLLSLLADHQDIEEHLLLVGPLKFTIETSIVTAIQSVDADSATESRAAAGGSAMVTGGCLVLNSHPVAGGSVSVADGRPRANSGPAADNRAGGSASKTVEGGRPSVNCFPAADSRPAGGRSERGR